MALRIKSLSVIALMIVFLFTMISGALSFQVRPPYAESQTIQALMIDVHHSLGMVFPSYFLFSLWRTPFDREDQSNRDSKSRFCYLWECFVLYIALHCLPDFVYSDFEMNMVDLLRNYDSGLFWSPLFRLSRYSFWASFEHTANLEGQQCLGDTSFFPH